MSTTEHLPAAVDRRTRDEGGVPSGPVVALPAPSTRAHHARIDRAVSSRACGVPRSSAAARAEQFQSILFPGPEPAPSPAAGRAPAFFRDLNLEQIVEAVTAGKQEYDLTGFFLRPLRDVDALEYRHDVMRDLQDPDVREPIRAFAVAMRTMRSHLGTVEKLRHEQQSHAWFAAAIDVYCRAVAGLAEDLAGPRLRSRGLVLFRQHLDRYAESGGFVALRNETAALREALSEIRYALLIGDSRILVRRYQGEPDYTAEVAATFAKFAQGASKSYLVEFPHHTEMNHVEAALLSKVARLHPTIFAELAAYRERHGDYRDQKIAAFDREIQFYLSYLEHMARLRRAGLPFCYPRLSGTSKAVAAYETYDLALAGRLVAEDEVVVRNDFHLDEKERIFVVSGPNQGGKTTFARTFGQLHYLASLGLPVPGRRARLFLCDRIFSHFEKEEHVRDLRGKLEDDLLRIRDILARATGDSVVVLNEIFTSTTLHDALLLSQKILGRVMELDALCVCVTFIDELASLGEQTVSMVSTVVPENPAERTYKVVRRPPDGLAYAITIAEKYRLTYDCLQERVP